MNERDSPNAFQRDKPGTNARTQAEGAIEDLRKRGGVFVNAVRATRMPMVLTDPNLPGNPIVFANEAFLKLSGYGMDEVLGQEPHFMNGAETDPKDAAHFREAVRSDQDDIIETVQYRKDGSRFVATVLISAFKGEGGNVLNHFMSWLDVTRRVDAERELDELRRTQKALRASEAKYRGLFDSIDEGFCVIEVLFDAEQRPVDYVFLETNPAFERQTGIDNAVGRRMLEIAPEHEQHWFDIYGKIALTGEPERFEQRAEALGRYYDVYAFRLGDVEDRHVAILFNDIGERKKAEEALRESERLRTAMLDVLPLGLALVDLDGNVQLANKEWRRFLPNNRIPSRDRERGQRWRSWDSDGQFVDPSNFPSARALRGETVHPPMEFLYTDDDGKEIWTGVASIPLSDGQGQILGAVSVIQDIDAGKRAVDHQEMLLAELQHRVRNILAMIRSVARRTGETTETVEDYVQHLEGRISAMARTQALLTREVGAEVDLQNLLLDELETQAAQPEQYRLTGPDVALPPKPAEVLGLALHELATNSVKYGALSGSGATLDIRWALLEGEEAPQLSLIWSESGLDLPDEPRREGFGTELITHRVPYELHGTGTMEFTPQGLVATIEFPLTNTSSILQTDEGSRR